MIKYEFSKFAMEGLIPVICLTKNKQWNRFSVPLLIFCYAIIKDSQEGHQPES